MRYSRIIAARCEQYQLRPGSSQSMSAVVGLGSVFDFLGPVSDGLSVFGGGGRFVEFEYVAHSLDEYFADFGGAGEEEFLAEVDLVEGSICKVVVEVGFQGYGVFGEEQGVGVEAERDRGAA